MNPIIPEGFVGEQYSDDVALIFKPKKSLLSKKTEHQQIDIVETESYGKILFLDNLLMKTDRDGHIINEMIVHVPMHIGQEKKNVLIVGGGEGFSASELLNYPELDSIDVIDIDHEFVDSVKEFYPEKTKSFDHAKVNLHIIDGLEFIKKTDKIYDIIFVTSTDPSGLSKPLFTDEFYKLCHEHLKDDGLFMTDAYMPYYELGDIDYKFLFNKISQYYPICRIYNCVVPSFPGGLFSFVIGSKKHHPVKDMREPQPHITTKYYNQEIHKASFALPQFMKEALQ